VWRVNFGKYWIHANCTVHFISCPIKHQATLAELFNFGSENPLISGKNAAKVEFFCRIGCQTCKILQDRTRKLPNLKSSAGLWFASCILRMHNHKKGMKRRLAKIMYYTNSLMTNPSSCVILGGERVKEAPKGLQVKKADTHETADNLKNQYAAKQIERK